ncbi:hypothetical protein FGO68_gene14353 [Halteria grandinella]|uniref:Uncharacterized protein n=1 Tax=Halteria grandinella TaxID=5974 RepID=A0A8J8NLE7_HALGN|nr:hypothetical protein FGO68_gene14353 [Halteria grandinella]
MQQRRKRQMFLLKSVGCVIVFIIFNIYFYSIFAWFTVFGGMDDDTGIGKQIGLYFGAMLANYLMNAALIYIPLIIIGCGHESRYKLLIQSIGYLLALGFLVFLGFEFYLIVELVFVRFHAYIETGDTNNKNVIMGHLISYGVISLGTSLSFLLSD